MSLYSLIHCDAPRASLVLVLPLIMRMSVLDVAGLQGLVQTVIALLVGTSAMVVMTIPVVASLTTDAVAMSVTTMTLPVAHHT